MVNLARDLVQEFRLLWRAPGFAVTASLTLALGIGATTTLFSVVHAVLIDPLPFPDSGKLIQLWRAELPALTYGSASYARYLDWQASQRPFIGEQVRAHALDGGEALRTVVGVVAGARSRRPELPSDPEVHAPFAQLPVAAMSYVVRAEGDPSRLTAAIRASLSDLSPELAMASVRTFDEVVATATRTSGLLSWLSALFAGLAAGLAVVGVYGVMACTVAQRQRELAIRAAVGATRPNLLVLVLTEGLTMSTAGIAIGALIAWATSGVLRVLLYEVSATDVACLHRPRSV